jgi:hypothetical protein
VVIAVVVSQGLAAQILTVGSPLVAAGVAQAIARLPGRMTVRLRAGKAVTNRGHASPQLSALTRRSARPALVRRSSAAARRLGLRAP